MTGYGISQVHDDLYSYGVEARSVNHKYCDVRVKMPREINGLEPPVETVVRDRIARGRVDLYIECRALPQTETKIDTDLSLARGYYDAFEKVRKELGFEEAVSLGSILEQPGIVKLSDPDLDLDGLEQILVSGVHGALDALIAMREQEGQGLEQEITRLLSLAENDVERLSKLAKNVAADKKDKLSLRVQELLGDIELDEGRIAQEIALLADKSDITEEISRLKIHLDHFRKMLVQDESVGRRLDFLTQEMNREVNTAGSKIGDANAIQVVVNLKSLIEKVREQVQNVE
uniref:Uncharacterized stress-induced protein n=1 Tax=uncultured myxobacterium HF0070_11L13 TaxID=723554 RepID=E7C222_9BACT|nr:uncharacterized stress-induced protein [uncultured myxobacterium HF0070_11L13]